jgi:L-lactate utilization protein LutC
MQQKMGLTKEQKTSTLINMSEKSKYIQIKKKKISLDDAVSKAMNKEEKTSYITKKKPEWITKKVKDPVDRKAQGGRAGYSKGGGVRKIAKGCGAVMRKKKTLYI